MAVADSSYLFRLIDVGAPGRMSDGGVFKRSPIGQRLHSGLLGLPSSQQLPGSEASLPYVLIGDEAFQLREDFLRPYPGSRESPAERIFNYRLSRARRCVENALGILTARFRIFRGPIKLKPDNAERVVKAACVLHNFLCVECRNSSAYCPVGYADHEDSFGNIIAGSWRSETAADTSTFALQAAHARKSQSSAQGVRDLYAQFVANEGQVPWQWNLLDITEPDT
ncbi:uncharacterized protein LOC135392644 [Ornithodoros turicata]|uniref:uncharacterized protein LOC135392644 n=1 Tax=Ornithodoros turicata TaxID=34597 RepID=UPI003139DCBD